MATTDTPLPAILQALRDIAPRRHGSAAKAGATADRFCAEGALALDALALAVQGVGPLGVLTAEAAQALHAASVPARHGLREATLLDTRVRDSGEIDAAALTLHWADGVLSALQAEVAQALGLQRLVVQPHKLLVYGPGQFFKPHQDTEKHRGMVATLVLVWPSAHIGGELRVVHGERSAGFASQHLQASALRWFAFYADCRHEVLPVQEGWRVVLTFDLVLPTDAALPSPPVSAPLLAALRAQFLDAGQPRLTPWVFLLDHEYTEQGLRWPLLKGEDRSRVAALRAAAESLGLTVHLALAEIHETWSATPTYHGRRGGPDTPQPEELIDEEMALDFWVDANGGARRGDPLQVARADSTGMTDTNDAFLVNEEYEGYMGNYGETLDYWYRRAALVIRTPQVVESNRFVTNFDAALADALALARAGHGLALSQRVLAAGRTLDDQRRERGRALLPAYAELAAALPDAAQAHALCEGFEWRSLLPDDVKVLVDLERRWGAPWLRDLVGRWTERTRRSASSAWASSTTDGTVLWPQKLADFIRACRDAGLPATTIDDLLEQCLATLDVADSAQAAQRPAQRLASQPQRLQRVVGLATALQCSPQAARHLQTLVRQVQAQPVLYPLLGLCPLLQALPGDVDAPAGVRALRAATLQALQQALATPEQHGDDYRVDDIEWTCRCADCAPVIRWAASPSAQPLMLAMAEARRQHVQSQLQAAAAPLGVATLKQGSPYKLVIRKPDDLHASLRARRQVWVDDLARVQAGALAPKPSAGARHGSRTKR